MSNNLDIKKIFYKGNISYYVAMISVILYSIWLFLPAIQNALGARAAILFMVVFFCATFLDKSFFKIYHKEYLLKIIILVLVSIFYSAIYTIGFKNLIIQLPQIFMLFFPILVAYYIVKSGNSNLLDTIFIITLVACIITAIINLTWLFRYRLTLRYMAYGSTDNEYIRRAMSYGIGGFGFTYGLNIFFALLLYSFFRLKYKYLKLFLPIVLLLFALSIYKSRYFISLFLLICTIAIYVLHIFTKTIITFFKKKYSLWYTFFIGVVLLIILFFFRYEILTNLSIFLNDYGLTDFSNKLIKIREMVCDYKLDFNKTSRLSYYINGIDTIIKSPLIGIKLDPYMLDISRHSTFIDTFAGFGIPAGLVAISLFIYSLKGIYTHILSDKNRYILVFVFCVFFMLFISNTIIYCREAFFICFLLSIYLDSNLSNNIFMGEKID